jgi:hypothetical protein
VLELTTPFIISVFVPITELSESLKTLGMKISKNIPFVDV